MGLQEWVDEYAKIQEQEKLLKARKDDLRGRIAIVVEGEGRLDGKSLALVVGEKKVLWERREKMAWKDDWAMKYLEAHGLENLATKMSLDVEALEGLIIEERIPEEDVAVLVVDKAQGIDDLRDKVFDHEAGLYAVKTISYALSLKPYKPEEEGDDGEEI